MTTKEYLRRFFEEKEIPEQFFVVKDRHGDVHYIDKDWLVDVIINYTPTHEQKKIADILRRIDFLNGNVSHFLAHLAEAYVKTNY